MKPVLTDDYLAMCTGLRMMEYGPPPPPHVVCVSGNLLPLPLGGLSPPHLVRGTLKSHLDIALLEGADVVVRGCNFLGSVNSQPTESSGGKLTSNHSGLMAVTVRR